MRKLKKSVKSNNNKHWWTPIEKAFVGVDSKGLKVVCPQCNEMGLVTTRWIKGPALKPIYILHIKWRKVKKVCELTEEQSKDVRGKVSIVENDIKNFLETKKSFVLFSGGNDSIATLMYLKGIADKVKSDLTAIYVDTTAGIPANTRYVKKVCKYLNVNLKIVKPDIDYFTLAKEWGIPGFKYRWCCRELKIKPIEKYLNKIKESKSDSFYLLGFSFGGLIAHDISERYPEYFSNELKGIVVWAPPFLGLNRFLNIFYSSLILTSFLMSNPKNLNLVMKAANFLGVGLNKGDTEDLILTDKQALKSGMNIIKSSKYNFNSSLKRLYIFGKPDVFVSPKNYDYVQKMIENNHNSQVLLIPSGGHFGNEKSFRQVNSEISHFLI